MWLIIDLTEPEYPNIVTDSEELGQAKYFETKEEAIIFADREVAGDYQIVEVDI